MDWILRDKTPVSLMNKKSFQPFGGFIWKLCNLKIPKEDEFINSSSRLLFFFFSSLFQQLYFNLLGRHFGNLHALCFSTPNNNINTVKKQIK